MKNLSVIENMYLVVVNCSVDTGEYFPLYVKTNMAAFTEKRPLKKYKSSLETALKVLKSMHLKNPGMPMQDIYDFADKSFGIENEKLISECVSKGSKFEILVEEIPVMQSSKTIIVA